MNQILKGLFFFFLLGVTINEQISAQNQQEFTFDTASVKNYLDKARIFSNKNQLDSSIYYDKLVAEIYLAIKDTAKAAQVFNYIAKLFQRKFEFDSAFAYVHKGINLLRQTGNLPPEGKGLLYNTLGSIYFSLGDYANAQIYYKHSLDIRLKYYSLSDRQIGDSYTNLGNVQFEMGHYDDAIEFYHKALDQRLRMKSVNSVMAAKNYNNIGYTFLQKNNISEAKKHFLQGFLHSPQAAIYYNLGRVFAIQKNFFEADTSLKKALEIRISRLGRKHFLTAESFAALAELEKAKGDYSKALAYYSEALNSLIKPGEQQFFQSNNAHLYDIISIKDFFISLNGKVEMLIELAKKDSAETRLLYAHHLLSFCVPLLTAAQERYDFDHSKLKLRDLSDKTMNLGVETCYQLYQITGKDDYAADAFLFSETKRSSVLNETRKKRAAMLALKIPDSIKIIESSLRQKLNLLFTSFEEGSSSENEDVSKRENLIATIIFAYDSIMASIKRDYPKYADLASAENGLALKDLKNKITKNDLLLEYTVTQKDIFVFCITSDSFYMQKKDKPAQFDKYIRDFNISIRKIDKKKYNHTARILYKELITPVEKEISEKKNVIIIPSPEIASIPFEALISPKGLPLVQNVVIQYRSSTNYFEADSFSNNKVFSYYFTGFAPSYNNTSGYPPLKNVEELNEIISFISSRNLSYSQYKESNATKQNFFSAAGKSKILHIAAHSYANTVNDGLSGIIFSNELLTASEIIAGEMNNDLLVLSSCEGGKGKTASGEGVLSLARNFMKAGVNNVLAALWKVPDKQTRIFMSEFYRQVVKSNSYSEALTKTKRLLIKDKLFAFPNSWAAFVLMK